jgi:hypothetical protein
MTTYLADNSYLAIGVETTAGTAVIPDIFVPLVSESMKTNVNHVADRRMKGLNWKANDLLRGNRMHEGEIVVLADPDQMAHFLNMFMVKGTTTGDSTDGYTHPFTVGQGDTYTFEVKKGNFVKRYAGCYIDEVKIGFQDGQMMLTMSVCALAQFSVASLGVALSGSSTSLTLDDAYDINPTRGLVAGDVLVIGSDEVTISTVAANGYDVTFTSTSLTYSVGEPIYLKPLTVSNATLSDPFYLGNTLFGLGADESAASTAAAARNTATEMYDVEISIKNNLFKQNGSSRFDPVQIIPQTREAQVTVTQLVESEDQMQKWLERVKQAMTMIATGGNINPDFSTQEKLTLKFNNVKLIESEPPLEVGNLIKYVQTFEVLYDNSDAAAMTGEVINKTAGTEY